MDQTATHPAALEGKLRARLPENTHLFVGSAPPEHARPHLAMTMLAENTSYVGPDGVLTPLPARVCAEWTTADPGGFWQVWAEQILGSPGRYNVRIDGPPGDLRLDGITESHLIALLELAGFIPADMMADIVDPPV